VKRNPSFALDGWCCYPRHSARSEA